MVLKGMTWSHARGFKPLEAASKIFNTKRPDVTISWDARSLADFELFPLDQLADTYDLIMIDHPHIGTAYKQNLLLPLDTLLPEEYLLEQEKNSVGQSHKSYFWEGHQYALAADAAAQVSAWRPDIFIDLGESQPVTWNDVIQLADRLPEDMKIAIPFVPVHAYSSFFTLCSQLSDGSFFKDGEQLDKETGTKVLQLLEKILNLAHPDSYDMDPIQLLDKMAEEDSIAYCPLTYGYSAYSKEGYSRKGIKFADMPSDTGKPNGSMIGGVGLAISSKCKNPEVAADFVMMVVDSMFQKTSFADNYGQPGHRSAWLDERVNKEYMNFYKDTLKTLDYGSMRPRFNGYIEFQATAGKEIRSFIKKNRKDYGDFIDTLNRLYTRFYNER